MKFIGHLDIMRYFQKAIRRANIPIAFSGGFSPHMIMSFAAPLGVGVTSAGEYFDMELTDDSLSSKEMENRLNATMAEGMKVISVRQISDGKASACMSLVAAAAREKNPLSSGKKDSWKHFLHRIASRFSERQNEARKSPISNRGSTNWNCAVTKSGCSFPREVFTT